MESITLFAPAKVNLRLEVLGKRPDGYHEIRTWIYPIDLCDQVRIRRLKERRITCNCDDPNVPAEMGNLAYQAAYLLMQEADLPGGVQIDISKRIPVSAGLGGGSSDAAAVLKGMNMLWGMRLPSDRLMELAARLGSDPPFFFVGQGALMGGRGERLISTLPNLDACLLLLNPGVPLSTKEVYARGGWGLTKGGADNRILMPPKKLEEMGGFLRNDLEGPAMAILPRIAQMKQILYEAGGRMISLTGSGPTVFALFGTEQEATEASIRLREKDGWRTIFARILPRVDEYWGVVKR